MHEFSVYICFLKSIHILGIREVGERLKVSDFTSVNCWKIWEFLYRELSPVLCLWERSGCVVLAGALWVAGHLFLRWAEAQRLAFHVQLDPWNLWYMAVNCPLCILQRARALPLLLKISLDNYPLVSQQRCICTFPWEAYRNPLLFLSCNFPDPSDFNCCRR